MLAKYVITRLIATDNAVLQVLNRPVATVEEMEMFNSELDDCPKYKKVVSDTIYCFMSLHNIRPATVLVS